MPDNWRQGQPTDPEATGDGSEIAILKRIRTLLGGTGKIVVWDGTDTLAVLPLGAIGAAAVAIVDADGNQITSFGGGTQYTEGDTDASITGTALMMEGAGNALVAAPGTAANGLDVDVTRVSGTVTVDGSGVTQPISHAALTELAAAIDTEVQVDIVGALPAGTNAIGKLAANSGVDIGDVDVTSLPAIPAGTNLIGAAVPGASATVGTGLTPYFDSDGDNTAQTMKGSAGKLHFLEVSNPNSSDAYIQLFDESGAITVGTTTPKLSLLVPAGDGTKDGAMDKVWTLGIAFANSIKYACTTTATGSGDPSTGLVVSAGYI